MKLFKSLFGVKCQGCGQKIKDEGEPSLLCQNCRRLEYARMQEEENERRAAELERREQPLKEEELKHKLQEEQRRKEEEQKRKRKKEQRKRKQGKPSFEEIQRLRAERAEARRLAEAVYQKKKLTEYEQQEAQSKSDEERRRKLKEENRAPNKLGILILKTGSKPLDEPWYIRQVMEAIDMPIYALPDGTHIENIRCVSGHYLNDTTYIAGLVIDSGYDPEKCTVTPFTDRDGGSGVVVKMRAL